MIGGNSNPALNASFILLILVESRSLASYLGHKLQSTISSNTFILTKLLISFLLAPHGASKIASLLMERV